MATNSPLPFGTPVCIANKVCTGPNAFHAGPGVIGGYNPSNPPVISYVVNFPDGNSDVFNVEDVTQFAISTPTPPVTPEQPIPSPSPTGMDPSVPGGGTQTGSGNPLSPEFVPGMFPLPTSFEQTIAIVAIAIVALLGLRRFM